MSACSGDWNERLSALIDGELSPEEARLASVHLLRCAACAGAHGAYLGLARRFASARERSPQAAGPSRAPFALALPRRSRARLAFALAGLAAAAALLVARPHGLNDALAAEVEQHHFRAFAGASPCEFSSDDPGRVRAWLASAVGYDVAVPAIGGATLLGARRCKLHGVPTAALLYRSRAAAFTLFIPLRGSRSDLEASRFGDGGGRCATGRLGESICALQGAPGRGATIAVSDAPAADVLAAARAGLR